MTHLGNSTSGIQSQVWPNLRPTLFPFHHDGLWEQRRLSSPWNSVTWRSFCLSSFKSIMNEVTLWSILLLKIKSVLLRFLVALKAQFPNQGFTICMPLILRFKSQSIGIICSNMAGLISHTWVSDLVLATHLKTSREGKWVPHAARFQGWGESYRNFVL